MALTCWATRATMAFTIGSRWRRQANPKRCLSLDGSATRVHELELLVIADQRRGEYAPGSCTHRPSHHGVGSTLRQGLKPLTTV